MACWTSPLFARHRASAERMEIFFESSWSDFWYISTAFAYAACFWNDEPSSLYMPASASPAAMARSGPSRFLPLYRAA